MSDSATPWTAAQASLSITNSRSLLKLMSIESMMPSNHLILFRPLLLLPSIFPGIRIFSTGSVHIHICMYLNICAVLSCSVMSNSLRPRGLQHTRPPCPSQTPRVHSNFMSIESVMSSNHLILIVIPFSSRLQSFPPSGSFPMSQFFTSGGQVLEIQLQHQSFQ